MRLRRLIIRRLNLIPSSLAFFLLFVFQPVFAFAAEEKIVPDWTMGMGFFLIFAGIAVMLVLRGSRRRESVLTEDELRAEREAELKRDKRKGH